MSAGAGKPRGESSMMTRGWLEPELVERYCTQVDESTGAVVLTTAAIDNEDLYLYLVNNRYPELTSRQYRQALRILCGDKAATRPQRLRPELRTLLLARISELGRRAWGCSRATKILRLRSSEQEQQHTVANAGASRTGAFATPPWQLGDTRTQSGASFDGTMACSASSPSLHSMDVSTYSDTRVRARSVGGGGDLSYQRPFESNAQSRFGGSALLFSSGYGSSAAPASADALVSQRYAPVSQVTPASHQLASMSTPHSHAVGGHANARDFGTASAVEGLQYTSAEAVDPQASIDAHILLDLLEGGQGSSRMADVDETTSDHRRHLESLSFEQRVAMAEAQASTTHAVMGTLPDPHPRNTREGHEQQ